jgi:hypothetical protein
MWENHAAWLFGTAPVRFDDMVTLLMPEVTENQHVFPSPSMRAPCPACSASSC